jgi:hypothetical protein
MNQPIENTIGNCRIADLFMPPANGNCDVRITDRT